MNLCYLNPWESSENHYHLFSVQPLEMRRENKLELVFFQVLPHEPVPYQLSSFLFTVQCLTKRKNLCRKDYGAYLAHIQINLRPREEVFLFIISLYQEKESHWIICSSKFLDLLKFSVFMRFFSIILIFKK